MKYRAPHALFGNGPEPLHSIIKERLKLIKTFFCVDGGADKLIQMGYTPDIILGDMDSVTQKREQYNCKIVPLENQSQNDMEKSLSWCVDNGIKVLLQKDQLNRIETMISRPDFGKGNFVTESKEMEVYKRWLREGKESLGPDELKVLTASNKKLRDHLIF